jgi:hypothetical protein
MRVLLLLQLSLGCSVTPSRLVLHMLYTQDTAPGVNHDVDESHEDCFTGPLDGATAGAGGCL